MPRKPEVISASLAGWRAKRDNAKALGICRDCSVRVPSGYSFQRCPPCRESNRASQKAWRERNRDAYLEQARESHRRQRLKYPDRQIEYRSRMRDKAKADQREISPVLPKIDRLRLNQIRRDYGLSEVALREILNRQDWSCGICSAHFPTQKDMHIDHCHKTGVVRGVLCQGCNTGLGLMCDDRVRLMRAIEYLDRDA